jgi:hypothetical protein
MASFSFPAARDKVRIWLHGFIFGLAGDMQAGGIKVGVMDNVAVFSPRTGATPLLGVATGLNGKGAITVTGTQVGDTLTLALNLTGTADATTSFESSVSVAGQLQQTSSSNLNGNTYLFFIAPTGGFD